MRVYISVDAEGISGVFKLGQVIPGKPDYEFVRKRMAGDVNAAARGAYAAGATEVVVNDTHNYGDNLLITDLDPRIKLLSGMDKPLLMGEGLQLKFDAMMLVGYHAKKGAKGVVSHTFFYGPVVEARINGAPFGEADFVAHLGGHFGTPMVFLSGDDQVTAEAGKTMPGVLTTCVKEYIGNGSALLYHPDKTTAEIEATAERAVRGYRGVEPLRVSEPVTLEVVFTHSTQAELACTLPGFEPVEGRDNAVLYTGRNYLEVYKAFMLALRMGAFFKDTVWWSGAAENAGRRGAVDIEARLVGLRKYDALRGIFYQYGAIFSAELDEQTVMRLNEVMGIE